MDLLFTLALRKEGTETPVLLTAPPGTSFSELEPLLHEYTEGKATWSLNGRPLGPEDVLVDVGLRDGAVLEALPMGDGPQGARSGSGAGGAVVAELEVVAGPSRGTRWRLKAGTYVIGRSAESDLVLASDEEVSRLHARLRVSAESTDVEDNGSTNGTFVAGQKLESQPVALEPGMMVEVGNSRIAVVSLAARPPGQPAVVKERPDGTQVFNRPPRIMARTEPVRLHVPPQPRERQKATLSLVGMAVPLVMGVVMGLLLKPIYVLFSVLSPAMMVSSYLSERHKGTRSRRSESAEYRKSEARYRLELGHALEDEAAAARVANPGPDELVSVVKGPLVRMWERRRGDSDYLELRAGTCDRTSGIELLGAAGSDGTSHAVERPVLHEVPATLSLEQAGVLGVCGPAAAVEELARWLVFQVAALHPPGEVRLAVLAGTSTGWDWAMWLPHLRDQPKARLAAFSFGEEATARFASQLLSEVESRAQSARAGAKGAGGTREETPVVVLVNDSNRLRANPAVAALLERGPAVGVFTICLAGSAAELPEECRAVAIVRAGGRAELRLADGSRVAEVVVDKLDRTLAEEAARSLAPVRLEARQEAASALSASVRLLDLLGFEPPSKEAVLRTWAASGRTTAAVIGVSSRGPYTVDMQIDGPHGLVAGTTGSGKSELLQTLIASLAAVNRPDALNFVLVDYKGGSAFSECQQLPHTVGMVTDLDGHLTERALASLGAEVRRRERAFKEAGAVDIDHYWRVVDSQGPTSSRPVMPRLLIVIDEFASLVAELPDFVDGLVDLARRGRSFGIHLVLATQRPAGVVSPAIKTNTNLRVAMRVTDPGDSTDVIDSALAAWIAKATPGRGYIRVGHDHLVEFQAARVGGRRPGPAVSDARPTLRAITPEALLAPMEQAKASMAASEETDLAALVDAVTKASADLGLGRLPSPWLDPLPDQLASDVLGAETGERERPGWVPYGMEDIPAEQARSLVGVDLGQPATIGVAGDSRSGRSSFLRALAASAAGRFGPADLHIYAIDCGDGALAPLASLPHCGCVASRADPERMDRLLSSLLRIIERRQAAMAKGGFSGLADQRLRALPGERLPYLLVLLDRWEGFVGTFEGFDSGRLLAAFQHLLREAPSAGAQFVLTGDRSLLIGRMATLAEQRLVLRLNDRAGYTMANINPRHLPEEIPPGRAFRAGSGRELHFALASADPSGPAQMVALEELARHSRHKWSSTPKASLPEPVSALPSRVAIADMAATSTGPMRPLCAPVGVGGNGLRPAQVDLVDGGPGFVVAGPRRSGRSMALVALAYGLSARGTDLVLVTSALPSPLKEMAAVPGVVAVLNGRTATPEELSSAVSACTRPVAVLVDDVDQLLDLPIAAALEGLLRGAREKQRAVVVAGGTDELNAGGFRGLVAEVKKSKSGLFLTPGTPNDSELLGVRLPRTLLCSGPTGRAVLVAGGRLSAVQVAEAALSPVQSS